MAFTNKFHDVKCSRCGNTIAIGALMNWNRKKGIDSRRWHMDCSRPEDAGMDGTENMTDFESTEKNQTTRHETNGAGNGWMDGLAGAILPYLEQKLNTKTDRDEVETIVKALLDGAIFKTVTAVEVTTAEGTTRDMGVQHHCFPDLLHACSARLDDGHRLNIWLVGPAGTGKTTAAKKVAEALDVPFAFIGAISSEYQMLGFVDASGRYHRTGFREIWEFGGVFLKDEVDGDTPSADLPFNAALANGWCTFPDSPLPVPRHTDCIIIAAANTRGLGATTEFVGRNKMDAAFLDRFVHVEWPIDEALELATCSNTAWTRKVQTWRKKVLEKGIKGAMVTPRASYNGACLLRQGMTEDKVVKMTVRKGMSDADWASIN